MFEQADQSKLGILATDDVFKDAPVDDIDALLKVTQRARLKLLTSITCKAGYDDDPKMIDKVLKALDGIDKQSLTVKNIASKEGLGNKKQAAIEAILSALTDPSKINNYNQSLDTVIVARRVSVEVPDDAEEITLVEGELSPIGKMEDYNGFMARMRAEINGSIDAE